MILFSRKYRSKTPKQRTFICVRYLLLWMIMVLLINLLYSYRASVPHTLSLIKQNEMLLNQIETININVEDLNKQLNILNRRDSGTYRMVFGLERHIGIPNDMIKTSYVEDVAYNDRYSIFLRKVWDNIYSSKIEIVNSSVAFDTIMNMASLHINIAKAIPTIWPINVKHFTGRLDHFGWRMHPVLKKRKFHSGLDLSCRTKTPVYATADAVVRYVREGWNGGYGNEVVLSHGMGYQTRYAHLTKATVKVGEVVKRGQQIALSGNTGRSTGSHLHYEVIYRNNTVNPLNYFRRDVTKDDFSRMIENAKEQSFEKEDDEVPFIDNAQSKKKKK